MLQDLVAELPKEAKNTDIPVPSGEQRIATSISRRDWSAEMIHHFV